MARTPFKLKSSPAKGALIDFFNSLGDQLRRGTERRIDKKYEDAGPNVRKQMLKEGYAKTKNKLSAKEKNQAKINAKNKGGGYSNATSVNALVVQRDRFRADPKNKGKKYPGQAEINKRLKKDPKKFD